METTTYKYFIFTAALLIFQGPSYRVNGDILSNFFSDYDKGIRPNFENEKPVIIECSLLVESFGNIEEANMEFKVFGYFRQYWIDARLAGKLNRTLTLKGGDIDNVWVPDPFCYNARESNMMMPNEEIHTFLHINPSGHIEFSKGITLLASCVMDLKEFPLDRQTCSLKFGSYGHTTEDIFYHWRPDVTEVSVQNSELSQFQYKGSKLTEGVDVYPPASNYSIITATFDFDRRIGYFLIQVYFPDIFVVVLSWIVFWMEIDDIGNRMALGITTILTIMFLLGSLNGNLPKVSYPKALDWYLLVSFSFVFLSLIECIVVFIICRKAKSCKEGTIQYKKRGVPLLEKISSSIKTCTFGPRTHRQAKDPYSPGEQKVVPEDDIEMAYSATKASKFVVDDGIVDENSIRSKQIMKKAEVIDTAARFLFPLTFGIYNVYYWIHYN